MEIIAWCETLEQADIFWEDVRFFSDKLDIKKPIKVKWNWRRFKFMYRVKFKYHQIKA